MKTFNKKYWKKKNIQAIFSTLFDFWRDLHKTYRARFSAKLFFFFCRILYFYYNFMFKLFVVAGNLYLRPNDVCMVFFFFDIFYWFQYMWYIKHLVTIFRYVSPNLISFLGNLFTFWNDNLNFFCCWIRNKKPLIAFCDFF